MIFQDLGSIMPRESIAQLLTNGNLAILPKGILFSKSILGLILPHKITSPMQSQHWPVALGIRFLDRNMRILQGIRATMSVLSTIARTAHLQNIRLLNIVLDMRKRWITEQVSHHLILIGLIETKVRRSISISKQSDNGLERKVSSPEPIDRCLLAKKGKIQELVNIISIAKIPWTPQRQVLEQGTVLMWMFHPILQEPSMKSRNR